MDRMVLDLGLARTDKSFIMYRWKYLFVGSCTGDVTFKLGSVSGSPLNPAEFDKLSEINEFLHLFITNTAQAGKQLVLYYEEDEAVVME